jgi:predicted nucleic acid-binding protein
VTLFEPLPIAVLDASVLVPAWSRKALQYLADGPTRRYQPVWSEWIVAETWYVLTERALERSLKRSEVSQQAKAMLRHLIPVMHHVSLREAEPFIAQSPLSDPDDAPIWATAVLADAKYVVSHNTHDFPSLVRATIEFGGQRHAGQAHIARGIEYLTAIEFIEDVLGENAEFVLGRPLPPRGIIRSQRRVTPSQ